MCAFSLHTRYSIYAIHYVYASQLIRLLYKGLARLKRIALVQNKVRIEAWVVKGIKKKLLWAKVSLMAKRGLQQND